MGDEVTTQDTSLHLEQLNAWNHVYEQFKVNETPNGPGSFMANTNMIRVALPGVLRELEIKTLLDAPCGDLNWVKNTEWDARYPSTYIGWDGQPDIIAGNKADRSQSDTRTIEFECVNLLTVDHFPSVDAILMRDFMIHLPMLEIGLLLDKVRASGAHYLIASTWPEADNVFDIPASGHDGRPGYWYNEVNLDAAPFNVEAKVKAIVEDDGLHELAFYDLWDF